MVVTRILFCVFECWYWVIYWIAPRPPWGIGALCYKNTKQLFLSRMCLQIALHSRRNTTSHSLKSFSKRKALFSVIAIVFFAHSKLCPQHDFVIKWSKKLWFKKIVFYLIHNFKVNAQSRGGVETAHFPLACATHTHLLHKTENTLWWMPVNGQLSGYIHGGEESEFLSFRCARDLHSQKHRHPLSGVKHRVQWPHKPSALWRSTKTKSLIKL